MSNFARYSIGLIAAAATFAAADPAWKTKVPGQWTDQDAQQVLTASPWIKEVKAVVTRRLTEDQLREAGQMGQPTGVGNEGVDPEGSGPKVSTNIFTGKGDAERSARSLPRPITLKVRWESALPIRIAEFRAPGVEAPLLDGNCYCIAVYGVPGGGFKGDPIELGKPLKNLAVLKRAGKKDVRPVRAEVFQFESGLVVLYTFPLSAEISAKDGQIRFEAQIGRVVLGETFDLSQMDFMGKLEL